MFSEKARRQIAIDERELKNREYYRVQGNKDINLLKCVTVIIALGLLGLIVLAKA